MKVFLSTILLLVFSYTGFSQEIDQYIVVDFPGKSQEEIQTTIESWIALHFKSAQNVIQQNSPGKIIVKGSSGVVMVVSDGKMKHSEDLSLKYTIDYDIKDEKYRFRILDPTIHYSSSDFQVKYSNMPNYILELEALLKSTKKRFERKVYEMSIPANKRVLEDSKAKLNELIELNKSIPFLDKDDDW